MYDPATTFAQTFPHLDEEALVTHGPGWWEDSTFHAEVDACARQVSSGTKLQDFQHPADTTPGQRERVIALRGIDAAFRTINPVLGGGVPPPGLAGAQVTLDLEGRFNPDAADGLVLPRLAWPVERHDPPLRLPGMFQGLTFIAADQVKRTRLTAAPMRTRMSREQRMHGLTVACVPATEDLAELRFEHGTDKAGAWYAGDMRDSPGIRDRFDGVLSRLDEQEVDIAILPELTCSDGLSDYWSTALPERHRADGCALRWVVAGSGNLGATGTDHVNEAILLDAATGEVIVRQRKQFPFDIQPTQLADYPLPFASATQTLRERIAPGYHVEVVGLGAARLAIFICEDLSRVDALLEELSAIGVSHIVTPVFSKPSMPFHWEQQKGSTWSQATGATVIVANSLVIGRLIEARRPDRQPREKLHTTVTITPWGWRAQRADRPEATVRVRLQEGEKPAPLDDRDGNAPVVD